MTSRIRDTIQDSLDLLTLLTVMTALGVFMALDLFRVIEPGETPKPIAYSYFSAGFLAATLMQRVRQQRNQAEGHPQLDDDKTP